MTAYSLTDNTGAAFGLGTVTSEESRKESNIFHTNLPLSDSSKAIMLDLFGVTRSISLKGVYTSNDGTIDGPTGFVQKLDGLIQGNQKTKTYVSGKSGASYTVLIDTVSWTSEEGGVNKVEYEIEMFEGSF